MERGNRKFFRFDSLKKGRLPPLKVRLSFMFPLALAV